MYYTKYLLTVLTVLQCRMPIQLPFNAGKLKLHYTITNYAPITMTTSKTTNYTPMCCKSSDSCFFIL